ncbi:MAG TPA: methyltransferase domain-containing protein [Pseudonocardiaceae bacterium]|jgi:SAM-dependent methyltransferase|nr:methyltransferase domain-containing protein [Pseudonocardiaceae bacterium]
MTATVFDDALGGAHCVLELAGGDRITLPVSRWRADPDHADELLLSRCSGPTLDVGCGPGRLIGTLVTRGVPALGVDVSPVAVRLTRRRGALAVRRDVFDRLPGEGRWRHVLLADGNVGIGGDPGRLLRRVAELLGRGGTALVELDPPGTGLRRDQARLTAPGSPCGREPGTWFPWARLGADATASLAEAAGLTMRWRAELAGRWFAELVRE